MDRPHRETKGVGFHIIFVKVIVQKIDFFFFFWYKCFIIWDFTLKFLYHFSGFCINRIYLSLFTICNLNIMIIL